jgi:hypothetical protein
MEVMFERVAGLDVGKAAVTVCVRTPGTRAGRRRSETRTFPTMTRSLGVMRDWLVAKGVSIAAIESTSTYWKPPLYCLEEVMEVWLLNAQHMKAVPGRKTDVRDAEWIAQMLEHGLLRPSFVPPPEIRRLRLLTRYRDQLLADRTREMIRLELMLEDASINVGCGVEPEDRVVAGDAGGDDRRRARPAQARRSGQGKLRGKIPQLAEALTGAFRRAPRPLGPLDPAPAATGRGRVGRARRRDRADVRAVGAPDRMAVHHPRCRPEGCASVHRRGRRGHVPVYESAGKRTPAGARHGNKWLNHMLVESAGSVGRMHGKNYLAVQHARLTKRRGMGRAQIAVAHSILLAAYWMLKRDEPYHDLGPDWHVRRDAEAHTRRLVTQLERLGHTVALDPPPAG